MRLDERGKQCPLPVIEAKKALEQAEPGAIVEVVVDNEIAVQNLKKLADHKGLASASEKVSDREFLVKITAAEKAAEEAAREAADRDSAAKEASGDGTAEDLVLDEAAEEISCRADSREKGMVVALASDQMGQGDEVLGKLLMKGFVYALTQQDQLPETVLLFNGGARLSCKDSDSLNDLKELEAQGTEILTCGTCLNHYGLSEQLAVGSVTNMYEIVERMTQARKLVRP